MSVDPLRTSQPFEPFEVKGTETVSKVPTPERFMASDQVTTHANASESHSSAARKVDFALQLQVTKSFDSMLTALENQLIESDSALVKTLQVQKELLTQLKPLLINTKISSLESKSKMMSELATPALLSVLATMVNETEWEDIVREWQTVLQKNTNKSMTLEELFTSLL